MWPIDDDALSKAQTKQQREAPLSIGHDIFGRNSEDAMLTLDHVQVRRRRRHDGTRVVEVVPRCGLSRARALELAELAIATAIAETGQTRAEFEEALGDVVTAADDAREARFARGLKKLMTDAVTFSMETRIAPEALRGAVFLEAAGARRNGEFHRDAILHSVAARHALTASEAEAHLYADLPSAHAVRTVDVTSAEELLARSALGELQAVVLRSSRLVAHVTGTPQELRAVLRALKFHQLLYEVDTHKDGALRFVIEGPMGLFQQSTRYGLKLAVVLPALLACTQAHVEATARLRKDGEFEAVVLEADRDVLPPAPVPAASPIVQNLLADLDAAGAPWRPRPALDVIRLPGALAIAPDIELVHDDTGEVVAVEVLGFWSRDAVWRRVGLVEQGLAVPVVFCASERLRVSEAALPAESTAALVVFKGTLPAARVRDAASRILRSRTV